MKGFDCTLKNLNRRSVLYMFNFPWDDWDHRSASKIFFNLQYITMYLRIDYEKVFY